MTGEASWEKLQGRSQPEDAAPTRIDELCAQIFSTNPGKELLDLLHAKHVDKKSRTGALEAHLREEAAYRNFVLDLEAARDKGLAATSKASAKPA